ncbi:ribonuclease HI family protein [Candidatus Bipolaricaulota bacterium]|nr:ribonuclease HI family protein [Candidatus Bipolaricaulota bacterium]
MNNNFTELNIYTDGASRGNPGDAAWGYLILDENDELITKEAGYIGRSTNNQAEYFAVIRALQRAGELTEGQVNLNSDSQLLIKQVTGQWKVKDAELYRLYRRVKTLIKKFKEVTFTHQPRENSFIARADQLCNDRLDEIQN